MPLELQEARGCRDGRVSLVRGGGFGHRDMGCDEVHLSVVVVSAGEHGAEEKVSTG